MVAVSYFEGGGTFPHVLAPAPLASDQVHHIAAVTIQLFSDGVAFSSVCAFEFPPFLHNRAGNPTPATFLTPRVTHNGLGFSWVGDQTLQVSWLFVADLEIIS